MTSCLCDISLGHVDTERREPRPSLFEKVEGTSGTAANVEESEAALIAPSEYLVERSQRLSPSRVFESLPATLLILAFRQ